MKMIVLDFSGTLSLGSVLSGNKMNLIQELKNSGLWETGINTPELFWKEVINPTWDKGSTTLVGYKELIFDKVVEISESAGVQVSPHSIRVSISKFVDSYYNNSSIEPSWREHLHDLLGRRDVIIVIATDNYAEATGHILQQLKTLNLDGLPVSTKPLTGNKILVANSADLGYQKSNRNFWTLLNKALGLKNFTKVVIVDDFGYNEQRSDGYSSHEKIMPRLEQTVNLITQVFGDDIDVFPFFIKNKEGISSGNLKMSEYYDLVTTANVFINKILANSE